jgi:surfactin synthase thioesterase subunit
MALRSEERWLLPGTARPARSPLIFCFPHAGGDPRDFLSWQPDLGDTAQVVPMAMPGRGHRLGEAAPATITELADSAAAAVAATADRPAYLAGHSLGALLAFEVARRLRDLPALRHLVASGCAAPALQPSPRVVAAAGLDGPDFADAVRDLGGFPPILDAEPELARLVLPALQADARLLAGYRYQAAAPLPFGISLVNGVHDPDIDDDALRPWSRECLRPPACHWAAGGHFYLTGRPRAVIDVISAVLRADGDAGAAHHVELI